MSTEAEGVAVGTHDYLFFRLLDALDGGHYVPNWLGFDDEFVFEADAGRFGVVTAGPASVVFIEPIVLELVRPFALFWVKLAVFF